MPDLHAMLITMPTAAALCPPAPVEVPRLPARARRSSRRPPSLDAGPIDVSVCIANWNCRELLRGCLESLLDQDQGVRLEVIVIDNGSTDGAAEMVAREFPEIVLHVNPANFGFARANNQAAARARGRYLFFLNNDTVIPAGTLRRLIAYADDHPEIGMIGPRLTDAEGQTQVSYRMRPTMGTLLHRTHLLRWTGLFRDAYRRYRRRDFDPDSTRRVDVLMGAALLLPRDVFFACGAWDAHYRFGGEDLDLSFQVNCRHPVVYHPEVAITHYGRVSTRQHIGFASAHMAAGFARYLRKTGCSRLALLAYKLVVVLDAPIHLAVKGVQYLYRRSQGRREAADKSLLAFRGAWHFLRHGLGPFLRA
jgi:GT2 family glycosyltransferase